MDNSSGKTSGHLPVLLDEVVRSLRPAPGQTIVDATFGGGGYSRAILAAAPGCRVIGVDRDPEAVARGLALLPSLPGLTMVEGRFGELAELLDGQGIGMVDAIVADLGVSSFQIDTPERGFSFKSDGPLDMRMGGDGPSAADLLASLPEREIADLLRRYGDEPKAGRIAKAIVARRAVQPLTRTHELRSLVVAARGGPRAQDAMRDPATLVFQALRIAVNDELGELERLLDVARDRLRPGGRLVVVTFHSGEDRIVKTHVDRVGGRVTNASRHRPPTVAATPVFRWERRGVVRPGDGELLANPRARSAKLRVAVRLDAEGAEVATDDTGLAQTAANDDEADRDFSFARGEAA